VERVHGQGNLLHLFRFYVQVPTLQVAVRRFLLIAEIFRVAVFGLIVRVSVLFRELRGKIGLDS